MKKMLSVLLAVLVMLSVLAVSVSVFADDAVICEYCGNEHSSTELGSCTCCLECKYLDGTKLRQCAKDGQGHFIGRDKMCCEHCTGFFPCDCNKYDDCDCPVCDKDNVVQTNEQTTVEIINDPTQKGITNIFQNVISKIAKIFNRIFEVVFAVFDIK